MHIEARWGGAFWGMIALLGCSDARDDDSAGGIDAGADMDASRDTGVVRDGARGDGGDAGGDLPDLTLAEQGAACSALVEAIRAVTSDYARSECSEAARREPNCESARDSCAVALEEQYAEIWQQFDCQNAPQRATMDCRVTRGEFEVCLAALTQAYGAQALRVTCSSSENSSPLAPPSVCTDLSGLCDGLAMFSPE